MSEDERDAHLRAALRHAPDAALAPPARLSDAILREARGAVAPPSRLPSWLQHARAAAAWLWAALGRPPVAAGFASVLVASVVGVMWWERPLDSTGAPVADVAPAAPTPLATAPASAAVPAPSPVEAAPAPETRAAAAPRLRQATPRAAPKPAPAIPAAPAEAEVPTPPAAAKAEAPPAQADAAPAAPTPPTGAATADSTRMAPRAAAAPAAKAARSETAFAVAPAASLAALQALIAAEPQRWTWQRRGAAPQPVNPALLAWLAAARDATAALPATFASPVDDAAELQLLQDGRVRHRLRVGDGGLQWSSAGTGEAARVWALPAASAAALAAALDSAAP